MRIRRTGGLTMPSPLRDATTSIEQFLLDRLAVLIVIIRRERVRLVASASASLGDGGGGVGVKVSAETDARSNEPNRVDTAPCGATTPELTDDGRLRGAAEAVWLRQAVVRALSPAVYARLASDGHLFPADQASNVNAVLRCVPAPVPRATIEALKGSVEATGRKWVAGGAT